MPDSRNRWIVVAAVLAAGGLGYLVARLTNRAPDPIATAERDAPKSADSLTLPDSFLATMDIVLEPVAAGDLNAEVQASAVVSPAANGQAIVTAHAQSLFALGRTVQPT